MELLLKSQVVQIQLGNGSLFFSPGLGGGHVDSNGEFKLSQVESAFFWDEMVMRAWGYKGFVVFKFYN